MATWVNLKKTVAQNSQNVWQSQWNQWWNPFDAVMEWMQNIVFWPDALKQAQNAVKNQKRMNNAKVEETIWWNNYYLPWNNWEQGQVNALNGTWHVAWIPRWPQMWLIEPIQEQPATVEPQAEQVATPTQQAPKTAVWWTKQPSISTPQNTQNTEQQIEHSPDIANWQMPDSWQQQQEKPANNMNEQAIADMQADLGWDNTWMLYGKVTADENWGNGIQTIADPYSVERATTEARIANLRKLQTMSSEDIATSITWWYTPYGDQAMRDLMQYNPEKYAEVQQFIKQQKWQNSINSITTGKISGMNTTQTAIDNVNNWVDSWADGLSSSPQQAWQLVTNISSSMANNWVATTATQEMLNLNAQMADIQEKMANVKKEAQKAFKWDVPQYIVDAYANNRLQEYQSQYNKLESRYNAAMDLYKTELDNAKRQAEMDLKRAQFQQNIDNENWTRYYKMQQLQQDSIKRVNWTAYQIDSTTWTFRQLTDQTAILAYQSDVDNLMRGWTSLHYDGEYVGYQCEQFTDNFTEASVWIRMTWENGRSWTTAAEKLSYVNDYQPAVWSVIVTAWWAYDSTYWHTMLITWYDPTTWLMNLMWANSNWDNTIHTSTTTMDAIRRNSQAMGIRNPYKTKVEQSIQQWGYAWWYAWANTPMTNIIDAYKDSSSLSAAQKQDLTNAEQMYNTMYEIINDGSLDALVNSDGFTKLMQDVKNKSFSATDEWDKFSKTLNKALKNYTVEQLWWEDAYNAMLKLQRLIEIKLRKESWAAISSSEWNSNFQMLVPSAWESINTRYRKLKTWDDIIYTNFSSAWVKGREYIPLFWETSVREIR